MDRVRVSSGAPWEATVGYSRAVRVGNIVAVSGTVAANADGTIHAPGDAYAQARRCLEIIEAALREAGASLADVMRTRMFVTDITRFEEFGRAHGEFFAAVRPAATMVEVRALIDPAALIEIEVEAVVADS
ncbi:MAG: RidA family protein [Dehalococcoidia bacterium]